MSGNDTKAWDWQKAIRKSGLEATTRHVLLNLASRMDTDGGNCFPSTRLQAEDTGLSERSICTHLEIAEKAGYVARIREGNRGQGWHYRYYPAFGNNIEGTEPASAPSGQGTEPASEHSSERTEPHDRKELKDVQCTLPVTKPINPPTPKRARKPRSPKKKPPKKAKTVLPAWLPLDAWADFVEHRDELEKPMSNKAEELLISKLNKLRDAGHDPRAVIEQSIMNNWQGFFEIKAKKWNAPLGLSPQAKDAQDRARAENAEILNTAMGGR